MKIIIAEQTHSEALANIVRSTFHLACPENSDLDLQAKYIAKNLCAKHFESFINSEKHIVLVALEDSEPAGLAVIEKESDSVAFLSKLYVLPKYHGKGLALSLFNEALEKVKSLGLNTLKLSVYSGNIKAKAFYEKQGFKHTGNCDFLMETELHEDHMYELAIG